jgi:hypothetical protein
MSMDDDGGLAAKLARLPLARRILLARRLAAAGVDPETLPILPVARRVGGEFELSPTQQGLWLAERLHPQTAALNVAVAARIEGALDVAALAESFQRLARRHESLRVELSERDGRLCARVSPQPNTHLAFVDLTDLPLALDDEDAARRWRAEARRPFDLDHGPLWRATLLRLDAGTHVIVLVLHHLIADNWSMGIVGRELGSYYEALTTGIPAVLPELPIQCVDHATWQRRRLAEGRLDAQLAYWKRQIPVAQAPLFPADHPRPAVKSYQGARVPLAFPSSLAEALLGWCTREGATLSMALVAGLAALLHRYTGADRVVIGTDVAGRERPELEGQVGFLVNQVVLCLDTGGNPAPAELLRRVRGTCLDAYTNQEAPFHKVVEAVKPPRRLDRTPLFQVKLDLLTISLAAVTLPGLHVTPLATDGTAKFDLEFVLWRSAGELHGFCEYSTDLFEAVTVGRLLCHFEGILHQMTAHPEGGILDIPLAGANGSAEPSFAGNEEFCFDP